MRIQMKLKSNHIFGRPRLKYIPVTSIKSQGAVADNMAELESFHESVSRFGVINPLLVRRGEDCYELISGARRLAAAKECGLKRVPCLILRAESGEISAIKLADNHQRKTPSFVDTAVELKALIYSHGCSIGEAAQVAGLSFDEATALLRTLRLGGKMLSAMAKAGLTEKHALALLRLGDEDTREAALCEMAYRGIEADAADKYVDALLRHGEAPAPAPRTPLYIMKDVRLFLNSVEHGVEIMRSGGIDAKFSHESTPDGVILTIKIPSVKEQLNAS